PDQDLLDVPGHRGSSCLGAGGRSHSPSIMAAASPLAPAPRRCRSGRRPQRLDTAPCYRRAHSSRAGDGTTARTARSTCSFCARGAVKGANMKFGLLPRIVLAILIGVGLGLILPDAVLAMTESFRVLLSGLLQFFIPLI